jgi:hypothetical protein
VVAVEAAPLDPLRTAELERMRGQIAYDQRRATDAARLFLSAARRLAARTLSLARETHLESLGAAMWAPTSSPGDLMKAVSCVLSRHAR